MRSRRSAGAPRDQSERRRSRSRPRRQRPPCRCRTGRGARGPDRARGARFRSCSISYKAETDPDNAFTQLFKLWKASYVAGDVDPCTQAQQQGLECLMQRGSFGQLRHYNRPAILLLNDDKGGTHQVVIADALRRARADRSRRRAARR